MEKERAHMCDDVSCQAWMCDLLSEEKERCQYLQMCTKPVRKGRRKVLILKSALNKQLSEISRRFFEKAIFSGRDKKNRGFLPQFQLRTEKEREADNSCKEPRHFFHQKTKDFFLQSCTFRFRCFSLPSASQWRGIAEDSRDSYGHFCMRGMRWLSACDSGGEEEKKIRIGRHFLALTTFPLSL